MYSKYIIYYLYAVLNILWGKRRQFDYIDFFDHYFSFRISGKTNVVFQECLWTRTKFFDFSILNLVVVNPVGWDWKWDWIVVKLSENFSYDSYVEKASIYMFWDNLSVFLIKHLSYEDLGLYLKSHYFLLLKCACIYWSASTE